MSHEEKAPRLVVAHGDPAYAALVCHTFHRLGWDVYLADSGPAVRKLAREVGAQFVVVDALLPNESGWLTCDKLRLELPEARAVIVAVAPGFHEANFAVFVGAAALVDQGDGVQALLDEIAPVAAV
jgi:DNA-binding response OmpR family regulator